MIKQATHLWDVNEVTLLEFGTGDISVVHAKGENYGAVLFTNQDEPHPVGEEDHSVAGKTFTDIQPDVVMLFPSIASIDVVMFYLQKAKEHLQELEAGLVLEMESNKDSSEKPAA